MVASVERLGQEHAKTEESARETQASLRETQASVRETQASLRETQASVRETQVSLRELKQQIGALGNKFGSYTEGLANPSLHRILRETFQMDNIAHRVRVSRGGRSQEYDLVGSTNGGQNEAVVVEIKSNLTEGELRKFEQKLSDFFEFLPEHRGKTLYGMLAAVDVTDEMIRRVAKRGYFLARAHDETFELQPPPKGFTPKRFR